MVNPPSSKDSRHFTVDALTVRVAPTRDQMALEAAEAAAACLRVAVAARGSAAAILASATSQIQFLAALTRQPGIDWSRVTLFHMDEYLGITPDHPASFRRFLRERVAERVHPRVYHYLAGEAPEPLTECDRYAALLGAQPIDLVCLGIGENGHLAFNDPPVADFNDPRRVKLVKLDTACRQQQVGEGCFPNLDAVPQYAFSLTLPALVTGQKVIGVVPEARKAAAVRDALRGPISPVCPASFLRRQAQATLYLDADAASRL